MVRHRIGIEGELSWRASQALYGGYQPYRPVFYSFNGIWAPKLTKNLTAEVVAGIGGFYRDTAYDSAHNTLEHEKNPDILSIAIRDLSGYAKPEVHDTLLKFLNSESYRNELAIAAIGAMRSQDDPACISPLLETLSKREADFPSFGFAQGLGTLAYLARNEEKKNNVREFLVGHVNDKRETVQLAALRALDTLGDPKAIAVLETFATASTESPERIAAARAVFDLRAGRKPVDDFKNLRQEVLDLEKSTRDLSKKLDDLKKQVEARESAPAGAASKKKPAAFPPKRY